MARSRLVAEVRAWSFTKREVRSRSLWAFQRYKCSSVLKGEGMEEMMGGFDQTHGKDLQEQVSVKSSWMSENGYPEPMLLHIEPSKKKKGSFGRGEDKKLRPHVDASLYPSIDMQNRVSLLEENLFKVLEEIKLLSQGKEILIMEKLEKLQKLDEKVQKIDENVEKLGENATGLIDYVILRDQETQSRLKRLEECALSRIKDMAERDAELLKTLLGMTTIEQKLSEGVNASNTQQAYSFKRVWEEMKRLQDGMTAMEQHLSKGANATNTQQTDSFKRVWEEMKRLQDGMTTILEDMRGGVNSINSIFEELQCLQVGITTIEQSLSDQKQVQLSIDVKESSSGKNRADVVLVAISSGLLACSTAMCAWTLLNF